MSSMISPEVSEASQRSTTSLEQTTNDDPTTGVTTGAVSLSSSQSLSDPSEIHASPPIMNAKDTSLSPLGAPIDDLSASSSSSEHLDNLLAPLVVPRDADSTFRSRARILAGGEGDGQRRRNPHRKQRQPNSPSSRFSPRRRLSSLPLFQYCCHDRVVRSTLSMMNLLAKLLFWGSVVLMAGFVVWYSYELKRHGTDPHLIAWFSAGAFVLLGFPISMYGIVMHLANYNQPHIQCYIVRILWMVPIYSFESWLCLRFHHLAIYIETLRDCYESYILYCFLQFLIQVLGGEEELVLMLKDKSPTRGFHMWGLQWCVKPWLMGQPVSRKRVVVPVTSSRMDESGRVIKTTTGTRPRAIKHVQWTSPFFVKCKVGVLQYVLLKFVSSLFVMVLELHGLYKEGDFTYRGGYLYICILTNLSQCWALYCLIFFYYATKNELSPIRPVGKFLSVKALVFFTWWQSVGISLLYQMDMIPHYQSSTTTTMDNEWTSEDVAKGLQDYLICIEMFVAAIVHVFVFPHTDYTAEAVAARTQPRNSGGAYRRVVGRKHAYSAHGWYRDDRSVSSKNSAYDSASQYDVELASQEGTAESLIVDTTSMLTSGMSLESPLEPHQPPLDGRASSPHPAAELAPSNVTSRAPSQIAEESGEDDDEEYEDHEDDEEEEYDMVPDSPIQIRPKTGFVKALLDSTIPRDVMDNTVGMVKGEFVVQKKTLLHHAATSDQYDLFSSTRKFPKKDKKGQS